MDLLSVSMNSVEFGFITQQIEASSFNFQAQIDFACKCYNLFLLYFYFQVMKFVIVSVTHAFKKTR